jgi:hypothetical protein
MPPVPREIENAEQSDGAESRLRPSDLRMDTRDLLIANVRPLKHGRMGSQMKQLQNAMLCVVGVTSVMVLYLAARSPSEQLADVAARLDGIEARLAAREELDVMHASLASDIDSQSVIRSAEGNVIGHWGVDEPLPFPKVTR